MVRETRIWNRVLKATMIILPLACGCTKNHAYGTGNTDVTLELSLGNLKVKSNLPEEEKISNVNLFIFDSNGNLEKHYYSNVAQTVFQASLLIGEEYTFTGLINFGTTMNVKNIKELENLRFHLVYPDEYRDGLPMYIRPVRHTVRPEPQISLQMTRLMSKISLRIDRSGLAEDVSMNVTGVRIGNCPKRMYVFKQNSSVSDEDNFPLGFEHKEDDCAGLNDRFNNGLSKTIDVYMLENMQGSFCDEGISADKDKIFNDSDPRAKTCSYIELDFDYISPTWASIQGALKYRFYLGDGRNNLDIERNCHYTITVHPKNEGLDGDGWRVDKSNLQYIGQTLMEQYPSDYIRGNIGEKIHIGCNIIPIDSPFNIGLDYLEYDKERGIYDYEIDPDGHGVTLTLTGSGTGLIHMEAGDPICDSALFLIEVNQP